MKKLYYLSLIALFFVSCKTSSPIVTSKLLAEKMGAYQKPGEKIGRQKSVISNDIKPTLSRKEQRKLKAEELSKTNIDGSNFSLLGSQATETALEKIGSRYKTGGTDSNGFDCSGLVYSSYKKYNIDLPRTSIQMSSAGIEITKNQARKGDLIFFKTLGSNVINHVGIVVENNESGIKFVHASIKKGVITSSASEGYYQDTFATLRRVAD